MTRTRRLRLCALLGALALGGAFASTSAPASSPEIAAQRAETRAQDAHYRAEQQVAVQSETAERLTARGAAETAIAERLTEQLLVDRAAAEQAVAEQAAADQAAADQAAADQAAADAAKKAAADATAPAARADQPSPAPSATTPPAQSAPACVNDSTYTGPPFYTSPPSTEGDGSNGNIPASAMTQLTWGFDTVGTPQYLAHRAAVSLDRLNNSYRAAFGGDLDLDLTYRSYAEQVRMREALGTIATTPGTSTHGTGRALDLPEWSCYAFGSERYVWLVKNGPAFGWVTPAWARQGGANPEYWHLEYTG
ncbi:D-alanyl-D-alanine carboxypeptidase [Sanguibacter gelidistatuariae]|uniref:D-alanyl-D-alanine carboxypeptidase n=1 Tax=Sanguibacter gelidistatuariae TaxID=1814289 RepID=A0A1G6H095_9MICO|nr:M15 family metallopeptidase [Sanguibacter gelidistatuariae]SDB87355.1 D-alanyl-D-alanine carboxypeptidase [Sanguibacter gelidistatuariae]